MLPTNNIIFWKTDSEERQEAIIFRRKVDTILENEKTVASELNNEQEKYQLHLQHATIYAKTQMLNRDAKAMYESKVPNENHTAYTVAVADFLNAPDIHEIDLLLYSGEAGDTIRVKVTDDFKVLFVKVVIMGHDGNILESGDALQEGDSPDWIYTATQHNTDFDGGKILIQASDLPGNISQKEETI
ncbi:MAG: hypothetical protein H7Y04_07240 [Verrucomicrobia bacterium]|nr:hypothetical protein [Cytophagales bacterium]